MDVSEFSLTLKAGEEVLNIGELLKEKKANEANPDFVSKLDELAALGEGKGLPFEFVEGEVVVFPTFEEMVLVVRITSFRGKEYKLLHVLADSDIRGKYLEIPLSVFRRVPALKEDMDRLLHDHPLNEVLLRNSYGDLRRCAELAGHRVSVDAQLWMAKVQFSTQDGHPVRVDVRTIPEGDRPKMYFYQVSFAD